MNSSKRAKQIRGGIQEDSAVTMDVLFRQVREEYGRKLRSFRIKIIRVLGEKSSRPAAVDTHVIPHCFT